VRISTKQESKWVVRKGFEEPSAIVKLVNHYQQRILHPEADLNTYKGDGEYNFYQFAAVGSDLGSDKNMEIMKAVTQAIDKNDESFLTTTEMHQVYGYIRGYLSGSPTWQENPQAYATNYLFYSINYGPDSIYGLLDRMDVQGMLKPDIFNGDLTESMIDRKGSLDDLTNQAFTSIIIGEEPPDYFETFVRRWKAEGGDDITREVNEWAAEFLK